MCRVSLLGITPPEALCSNGARPVDAAVNQPAMSPSEAFGREEAVVGSPYLSLVLGASGHIVLDLGTMPSLRPFSGLR